MENNIKKQELRLGNWVDLLDFVCELNENNLTSILKDKYECYPIPLTEEWLLKFGFEEKENSLFTKKLQYIYNSLKYCDDYKIWIYYNDDNDAGCNSIADLNYVHELQNLYFALTNEELTMK